MTPGAQQGSEGSGSAAGAENSNVVLREVSGKLDALIGVLTQQSRAPPSAAVCDSGQSAAGIEDTLGFANASPRAAAALAEWHTRHMRMARLLKCAGLADDEAKAPEFCRCWLLRVRALCDRLAGS
jgi:hypothetical protein